MIWRLFPSTSPTKKSRQMRFAFKTYSENEGLLEELLQVKAVEFTGRYTRAMMLPIRRLPQSGDE